MIFLNNKWSLETLYNLYLFCNDNNYNQNYNIVIINIIFNFNFAFVAFYATDLTNIDIFSFVILFFFNLVLKNSVKNFVLSLIKKACNIFRFSQFYLAC